MKTSTTFTQAVKRPFFAVKKWIKGLSLHRSMTDVLMALLFLVDGTTLASMYPITIDRLAEEAGYSRTQLFVILNDLERAGHVERTRHRRQLEDGSWINDPTSYRIITDEQERAALATQVAAAGPRKRHPKKERIARPTPMCETFTGPTQSSPLPVEAPRRVEPIVDHSPPVRLVKVNPAPHVDEMTLPPEKATGDEDVDNLADVIEHHARAAIRSAELAKPKSAAVANKCLDIAKYTIAKYAMQIRGTFLISESDIIDCAYEWVVKCVEKNLVDSPRHMALILKKFFYGKGDGIAYVRKELMLL
jgi:hypothetical protein